MANGNNWGGLNYDFVPTGGAGVTNYQPMPASALPGAGATYLDSMAQYGGTPAANGPPGFQWGLNPETFGMVSEGLGALTSLGQLYGMFQSLGLQKKAFKFAQEGTKRNFNAQATAYNEAVASKETARRAYSQASGQDYGSMYSYGTGQKIDKWG